MIKCELVVGGYSYRVTDDVMNWDDIVVSVKRGDYDGVVRSFSSKFEFVNNAHAILKKQYRDNYLGAAASVVMSRRNNSWTWNELFRCTLDFSTYEDSGNVISINAVDDSLASLIKAKKSTQYEYSVDAIKEGYRLWYDRMPIDNNIKYIITGDSTDDDGNSIFNYSCDGIVAESVPITLSYEGSPEVLTNLGFQYSDIPNYAGQSNVFFLTNDIDISVKISGKVFIKAYNPKNIRSVLMDIGLVDPKVGAFRIFRKEILPNGTEQEVDIDCTASLKKGDGLNVTFDFALTGAGVSDFGVDITVKAESRISINFFAKQRPEYIDVVSPVNLLGKLMQSMNGGVEGLTCEIDSTGNDRLENCMIIAAESVRGINESKLYSSFSKFAEWMKSEFGYVYDISGKKVTFRHRTKYFTDDIVKEVTEFADFSYNVNSSLIYSSVRVGYDKQDYDSVNGRDEFRFTNTFSTGVTLTDNSLDLISPYRADAYGIEFLVQKRGADTTDSDSDNDVFFVGTKLVKHQAMLPGNIPLISYRYELIRNNGYELSGVISPETMFNAMYSPRQMLLVNKAFIGCCTAKLTYASGEGNSDVVIGGIKEKDDVLILAGERIATVGELSFSTPEYAIPENQKGLVSLIKNGERYLGYIQKADMNAGREECTKFALSVNRIE